MAGILVARPHDNFKKSCTCSLLKARGTRSTGTNRLCGGGGGGGGGGGMVLKAVVQTSLFSSSRG